MIDLFNYTDYRKFLKDYYDYKKKTQKGFSYRYFAGKLKKNSSGLLKNIIEGRRSLGSDAIYSFTDALKLTSKQSRYFENLVLFNEASTLEARKLYFERMLAERDVQSKLIDANGYEYYSKWYYVAIRELLTIVSFKGKFADLGRMLKPAIRPDQAEKAIKVLTKLGLITKDKKGIYQVTNSNVSTGPEAASLNVANYQVACMELALGSVNRHHSSVRDITSLALCVNDEGFQLIKEEIAALRKKLLRLEHTFENKNQVYQVNMQVFPLASTKEGKKK